MAGYLQSVILGKIDKTDFQSRRFSYFFQRCIDDFLYVEGLCYCLGYAEQGIGHAVMAFQFLQQTAVFQHQALPFKAAVDDRKQVLRVYRFLQVGKSAAVQRLYCILHR